jgi:hypothetical protein
MPSIKLQRPKEKALPVNGPASAWDLPAGIKIMLYGRSGTGKTTLWATFPRPILALICSGGAKPGELRSIDTPDNRKTIDARIVCSVEQLTTLLEGADKFKTVVLDHVSGLQDLSLKEILGIEELPAQKGWGLASQQQWGQSTAQCKEICRTLLSLDANVVIIGQERTNNEENQSEIITPTVGVACTPSLALWLNPAVDYIVQTFIRPKMEVKTAKVGGKDVTTKKRGAGVEYCARTGPHDVFTTKFRMLKGRKLPDVLVDPSFAKIQDLISGRL